MSRVPGFLGARGPDLLADRHHLRELVNAPGLIPRIPRVDGETGADVSGFLLLGTPHRLADGALGGVLVAGPGRISRRRVQNAGVAGGPGCSGFRAPWIRSRGQQRGVLVHAPRTHPPPFRCGWRGWCGLLGFLGARTEHRPVMVSSAGVLGHGPTCRIPLTPRPVSDVARVVRVFGCSGPSTRSRTGSSSSYWSLATRRIPAIRSAGDACADALGGVK